MFIFPEKAKQLLAFQEIVSSMELDSYIQMIIMFLNILLVYWQKYTLP
jgi:hypothetical protein